MLFEAKTDSLERIKILNGTISELMNTFKKRQLKWLLKAILKGKKNNVKKSICF